MMFFDTFVAGCFLLASSLTQPQATEPSPAIHSEVVTASAGDLILIQTMVVKAPVAAVWQAYTTSEGWMAWAAPHAEVDLRAGGTIRTHYAPDAEVGDDGTNTLQIVNYVPERALTLRAELSQRWPDVMKEDAGKLMNLILFASIDDEHTRIESYGVGYRDIPAYQELMKFFIPANEGLLEKLKAHLETDRSPVPSLDGP